MKNSPFALIFILLNIFNTSAQNQGQTGDVFLRQMTDSVLTNHYSGIHSILVADDKNLIYERYFNGYSRIHCTTPVLLLNRSQAYLSE